MKRLGLLLLFSASSAAAVEVVRPQVRAVYPHDPAAYTEGLVIADGRLFETTGLWGHSSLREVELSTGTILRSFALDDAEFGEGVAFDGGRLIMLTFNNGVAHVHDANSFAPLNDFFYEGQGWGLCNDGKRLLMTDGTPLIQVRDLHTFERVDTISVTEDGLPFAGALNEIECFDGKVLANVWPKSDLVSIDAGSGQVLTRIDAYGLLSTEEELAAGELNGIAFDAETRKLYLTGKLWPKLFEVAIPNWSAEEHGGCTLQAAGSRNSSFALWMTLSLIMHLRARSSRRGSERIEGCRR